MRTSLKTLCRIILLLGCLHQIVDAQAKWKTLPNAPKAKSRIDDFFFISPLIGWAVKIDSGQIYKTTDGGLQWSKQLDTSQPSRVAFRSIGFADSLFGWAGVLSNPTAYLWQTSDGGTNWSVVPNLPSGPIGICGISVVNRSVIYGCGNYNPGSPHLIKTTNGGQTWTAITMSTQAGSLVDCYFWSPDSGFVVGSGVSGSTLLEKKATVLFTSDGGQTWQEKYLGNRTGELSWKITFPGFNVGFVSIWPATSSQQQFYLKTTDRGATWQEQQLPFNNSGEGIGFTADGSRGWIGGWGSTYETTNGGVTWTINTILMNLNRVRFINDSIAYASGQTIYKYTSQDIPVGMQNSYPLMPRESRLDQNYPNPFNPSTTIEFTIHRPQFVSLKVVNALGQEIATLANEELEEGLYRKTWNGVGWPSGTYFYKLVTSDFSETRKMLLIK